MKESDYFRQQADIATKAANSLAYDPWVRAANRAHARACHISCWEAQEVESLEARLAQTEDRCEQLAFQAEIDEIRHNQEARYENAR